VRPIHGSSLSSKLGIGLFRLFRWEVTNLKQIHDEDQSVAANADIRIWPKARSGGTSKRRSPPSGTVHKFGSRSLRPSQTVSTSSVWSRSFVSK
jgi:hypothetical protein